MVKIKCLNLQFASEVIDLAVQISDLKFTHIFILDIDIYRYNSLQIISFFILILKEEKKTYNL